MNEIDRRRIVALIATSPIWLAAPGALAKSGRFPVTRTAADWRQRLGPQRYHILREGGTERAFTRPLDNEHRRGTFVCAGCAQRLFASATKFDSGTGWPSFWKSLPRAIITRPDRSYVGVATEVLCARCGGHLGHVFDDGPKPTGLRYCMNGLALSFRPAR